MNLSNHTEAKFAAQAQLERELEMMFGHKNSHISFKVRLAKYIMYHGLENILLTERKLAALIESEDTFELAVELINKKFNLKLSPNFNML